MIKRIDLETPVPFNLVTEDGHLFKFKNLDGFLRIEVDPQEFKRVRLLYPTEAWHPLPEIAKGGEIRLGDRLDLVYHSSNPDPYYNRSMAVHHGRVASITML